MNKTTDNQDDYCYRDESVMTQMNKTNTKSVQERTQTIERTPEDRARFSADMQRIEAQEQKHTPGARKAAEIIMGDDEFIFTTYGKKTVEGLAELIDDQTAAPELLEACKAAKSMIEQFDLCKDDPIDEDLPIIAQLKAVIQKAEGK